MEIDKNTLLVDLAAYADKAGLRLSTDRRGRLQIPDGLDEHLSHDDDHQAFLVREVAEIRAAGGVPGPEHIEAQIHQIGSELKSLAFAIRRREAF